MTYREQITPWLVMLLLPDLQRQLLARFKSRSDANGYAQTLRRSELHAQIVVCFDSGQEGRSFESI